MLEDIVAVAIALASTYLLLSIVCTTVTEFAAARVRLRAHYLQEGIQSLFDVSLQGEAPKVSLLDRITDAFSSVIKSSFNVVGWLIFGSSRYGAEETTPGLSQEVLKHPLVCSFRTDGRLPSYLPPSVFAAAVLDNLSSSATNQNARSAIRNELAKLNLSEARSLLDGILGVGGTKDEMWSRLEGISKESKDTLIECKDHGNSQVIRDVDVRKFLEEVFTEGTDGQIRTRVESMPFSSLKLDVLSLLDKATVATLLEKVSDKELRRTFRSLFQFSSNNLEEARGAIEKWYIEGMERVSGWYKRRAQIILVLVAIPLVVSLNADTFTVAKTVTKTGTAEELTIPLGWKSWSGENKDPREHPEFLTFKFFEVSGGVDLVGWLAKILGLSITVLAVSQGSDFWWQKLNQFVNLRASGPKPENST